MFSGSFESNAISRSAVNMALVMRLLSSEYQTTFRSCDETAGSNDGSHDPELWRLADPVELLVKRGGRGGRRFESYVSMLNLCDAALDGEPGAPEFGEKRDDERKEVIEESSL